MSKKTKLQDLADYRGYFSLAQIAEYVNASAILSAIARGINLLTTGPFQYIFLPLAVATSLVKGLLHWKQSNLEKQLTNNRSTATLAKLALEIGTAIAVSIAILGAMFAQLAFALATPVIVVAAAGTKAILDFFEAIDNFRKAYAIAPGSDVKSDRIREDYMNGAKAHFTNALTSSAVAVGISLIAWTSFATFGVFAALAATVVGAVGAAYFKAIRQDATLIDAPVDAEEMSASAEAGAAPAPSLALLYGINTAAVSQAVVTSYPYANGARFTSGSGMFSGKDKSTIKITDAQPDQLHTHSGPSI